MRRITRMMAALYIVFAFVMVFAYADDTYKGNFAEYAENTIQIYIEELNGNIYLYRTEGKVPDITVEGVSDLLLVGETPTATPAPSVGAAAKSITVGTHVYFGHYPQTTQGESLPIEWVVLERKGEEVLLLAQKGLEVQPYQSKSGVYTWDRCTLRTFLNDDFYYAAFSEAEQSIILSTKLEKTAAQSYDIGLSEKVTVRAVNATKDNIFILSLGEVLNYLPSRQSRRLEITDYAKSKGAYMDKETMQYAFWWLRDVNVKSNGMKRRCILHVQGDGAFARYGQQNMDGYAVRPAMWITLQE